MKIMLDTSAYVGFKAGVALRSEYFFGIIFQQHSDSLTFVHF
jgi:hypothetical protein